MTTSNSIYTGSPGGSAPSGLPDFAAMFSQNPTFDNFRNLERQLNTLDRQLRSGNASFSLGDLQSAQMALHTAVQPYAQQFQTMDNQRVLNERAQAAQQRIPSQFDQVAPPIGALASTRARLFNNEAVNAFSGSNVNQNAGVFGLGSSPMGSAIGSMTGSSSGLGSMPMGGMTGSPMGGFPGMPQPTGGVSGNAFPSVTGYGGGGRGLALEGKYGLSAGNSSPFPIRGDLNVVKMAQGGEARGMFNRYAQSGMVDDTVSESRRMLQNLQRVRPLRMQDGGEIFGPQQPFGGSTVGFTSEATSFASPKPQQNADTPSYTFVPSDFYAAGYRYDPAYKGAVLDQSNANADLSFDPYEAYLRGPNGELLSDLGGGYEGLQSRIANEFREGVHQEVAAKRLLTADAIKAVDPAFVNEFLTKNPNWADQERIGDVFSASPSIYRETIGLPDASTSTGSPSTSTGSPSTSTGSPSTSTGSPSTAAAMLAEMPKTSENKAVASYEHPYVDPITGQRKTVTGGVGAPAGFIDAFNPNVYGGQQTDLAVSHGFYAKGDTVNLSPLINNMGPGQGPVSVDQNIGNVQLPGKSTDYTYGQAGNFLQVKDKNGNVVSRIAIQDDVNGTQLKFADGTVSATPVRKNGSMEIQIGGKTAGGYTGIPTVTGGAGNDTIKGGAGNDNVSILGPTTPLPDLPEGGEKPVAPKPELPPGITEKRAEEIFGGLDQGTAIVGKISEDDRVKTPQLDTEFRAAAPRTPVYDRFGRVVGYNYSPAAKLTPATGTNVFDFVPPSVTSRPRSLLSLADVPGVTIDPVTGQMQMPLSASQRFARDRATLSQDINRLYAEATKGQTNVPAGIPTGAATAFRDFVMSSPNLSSQLRYRDIGESKVDPTKADPALAGKYGSSQYLEALKAAFDPYMAQIRPLLEKETASKQTYFDLYPDVAKEFLNPSTDFMKSIKQKYPTPEAFSQWHYDTYGAAAGRTAPNLFPSPYQSYPTPLFAKGGPVVKKADGGDVSREDVSRGTASPETRGVSSLKGYGEGEEAASIRRSAHEALRGLMGMRPYEETNPSEAYRIASTATPLTMIGGGIRGMKKIAGNEEAAKAIGKAAEAAGMKAPATAAKSLTTLDDFHLSLGDQIRKRSADMQNLIESTPFKYSIGDRVFTADSARKNRPPLEILNRVMVGNDPMREGHPILGKVIKDPETGKTKRTPYEPGYEVLLFEGKDNWTKFRIPESAIKGVIDPIEPLEKQDGGEASTEEFIKKNVSRGTSEVPQLDTEGRLIDEREEIRSESQRMLNRLQSQPSKLPPGIRRTVAATREQGGESMFPAAAPARDLLSGILGASPTAPGSEAYRTGQAIANMPPVQAAAAIPAKIAASAGDAATALAAMGPAVGAVMKPKGGNWLAPSVERGLNYLIPAGYVRSRTGAGNRTAKETLEEMNRTYPAEELAKMSPETRASVDRAYQWLEPNVAIQNWIEKKLTKYVKNEMATPEDPVRALAERGILHVDPEQLNSYPGAGNPTNQAVARRALSYPEEGLARSEAAKRWETASDYMIQTDRALNLLNPKEYGQGFVDQTLAANPWLTKVDPYERIYGVDTLNYRPDYSELGFDHLIDELKNSLNPNSGLPRALQLTPKQLDKVSVPQAVELVDKINKWRAEQKVAADLKRSQNAATVEYKAYDTVPGTAEPNQRGLRWVELRAPTEGLALPEGYSIQTSGNTPYLRDEKGQVVQYLDDANGVDAAAKKVVGRMSLEDALKYEGETMGHCVGGYCPDVEKGRSRIYSLRDAKGEPHVTIEVQPYPYAPRWEVVKGYLPQAEEMMRARGITNASEEEISELATQLAKENMPSSIQQIKGKANRAPKDEYLPFVQDFVRSGQWSAVGDIRNTGLIEIDPSSDLARNIRAAGGEPPKFVTQQELTEWLNWWRLRQYGDPTNGFKKGGSVNVPRETSTSKQQLDKLAQVSQRKKA